jgi:hypothetical protein
VFNAVTAFKADNSGKTDCTAAVQAAIDAAGKSGGVVLLPKGRYRFDDVLKITQPNVVLRGEGRDTKLVFTRSNGMSSRGHITFQGRLKHGTTLPLTADAANRSRTVIVVAGADIKAGDEVTVGWTITDKFVHDHAMTGTWKSFNGKWRDFFRRRVTAVSQADGKATITLDVPLRYPALMTYGAGMRTETGYVQGCGVESLSITNAVSKGATSQTQVQAIVFNQAADCWVRDVHSFADTGTSYHLQSGGILVNDSKQITVTDCRMGKAQHRGGGGNGYLFQVRRSNMVLTRDCVAKNGRHNFIQNWDFGTSGCVWLRCTSRGSRAFHGALDPFGTPAYSEFHHSLAMACLIDQCTLDDGWYAGNRHNWSSGAGHTVTQSVFWNTTGKGVIRSWQFGEGYIIGTDQIRVTTQMRDRSAHASEPEDYQEGIGKGASLQPRSLYDDQLKRRLEKE